MTHCPTTSAPALPGTFVLQLPYIAAWQITTLALPTAPNVVATLPAMQRGAVWKPKQVELLWDSVARGFPIGAFLLAPFNPARGQQNAKYQQGKVAANYHLLDGQQRATAIALGFLDPWTAPTPAPQAVLWVDLAPPTEPGDVSTVFRVLTRSHPWGYRRNKPEAPLSIAARREALHEGYRQASPELKDTAPHLLPLTHVWPADALAPIPLAFVLQALLAGGTLEQVTAQVLAQLQRLPFWASQAGSWPAMRERITAALSPTSPTHGDWAQLVQRLRAHASLEQRYGVPVMLLPNTDRPEQAHAIDPLETLFIRVNQAGTRLEGEELIYSILKSNWTQAPTFIERLGQRLLQPPRLVMLASRLVLAQMQAAGETAPPAAPDVAQFRRLMHDQASQHSGFAQRLETFIQSTAVTPFTDVRRLLTDPTLPGGEHALPQVLAYELGQKTPDVLFLLLAWAQQMRQAGQDPCALNALQRRALLGFITALSWFAPHPHRAAAAVWSRLRALPTHELAHFFSRPQFLRCLALGPQGALQACPLPPPAVLEKIIADRVTRPRGDYGGFNDAHSSFWKNWDWYEWLQKSHPGVLKDWFTAHIDDLWRHPAPDQAPPETDTSTSAREQAWQHFSDQLWGQKSLLLYTQRHWIERWFPEYDPTQPDQMEDHNRPWDWDHIFPQRYFKTEHGGSRRNIPAILWDWHASIGNLRAWPLEANRADQDTSPQAKLSHASDTTARYGMPDAKTQCAASCMAYQGEGWQDWCDAVPAGVGDGSLPTYYLADPEQGGHARQALVRAITGRLCHMYRQWYEGLCIAALMPQDHQKT